MYSEQCPLSTRTLNRGLPLLQLTHHDYDDDIPFPSKASPSTLRDSWRKIDTYRQKPKIPPTHLDTNRPCIDVLCEKFNGMLNDENGISFTKLYPIIPDHDKRILNCMMLKRFNATMEIQNAWTAREYWEKERSDRLAIQQKQQFEYKKTLQKKHEVEKCMQADRFEALCRQHENDMTAMRREQYAKKLRAKRRVAKAEYERNLLAAQRQTLEKRRFAKTTNTRFRQQIDDQLKTHQCGIELDQRMHRATSIRKHHLNNYRKRIGHNNERHQMVHAIITNEIKEAERMHLDHLKEKIAQNDRRSRALRLNKLQWLEESRDRAQLTATLRDIVRKSVTPDNFLYGV